MPVQLFCRAGALQLIITIGLTMVRLDVQRISQCSRFYQSGRTVTSLDGYTVFWVILTTSELPPEFLPDTTNCKPNLAMPLASMKEEIF